MAKKKSQEDGQKKKKNIAKEPRKRKSESLFQSQSKPTDRADQKKQAQTSLFKLTKTTNKQSVQAQKAPQQMTKKQSIRQSKSKDKLQAMAPKALARTRSKELVQPNIPMDYDFRLSNGRYIVKLHSTYQIDSKHQLFTSIGDLYRLFLEKQKRRYKKLHSICNYTFYPAFEYILKEQKITDDKCSICQFEFQAPPSLQKQLVIESQEDIIALPCSHALHIGCFIQMVQSRDWVKCPICSTIYGKMIGDQPNGTMTVEIEDDVHCDGYPQVGTIVIEYKFNSGVRNGVAYSGTSRTAYLPNSPEGQQVCELLRQAFKRKLIFTVGRSVTTGRDNQVVWNGVHHKTHTSGGSAYFGYPDETYFQRVKIELAAKGIR